MGSGALGTWPRRQWRLPHGDVTAAIPEPQTYALMLMGLGALALRRRLR